MGKRRLHIERMRASNLTRQHHGYRMAVHARAYITNDFIPFQDTAPDHEGDVNPRWDHPLNFIPNCSFGGTRSSEYLKIDLYNQTPGEPSLVGSLEIPLVRFLSGANEGAIALNDDVWPVDTGGHLYFSYSLGPYVNRFTKFFRSIGKIALGSVLLSFFNFEFDEHFGDADHNA